MRQMEKESSFFVLTVKTDQTESSCDQSLLDVRQMGEGFKLFHVNSED